MLSWARRLMIKACAEIVQPWKSTTTEEFRQLSPLNVGRADRDRIEALLSLPSDILQACLLQLEPLCRFVFVLRAIEGYTRRDTSLLLNVDDTLCEFALARAVEAMESFCLLETTCGALALRNGPDFCAA